MTDYCDHLIVIDTESEKVVGTYRMMPDVVAENSIGYYSETEFDLTSIRTLPDTKLELGRSCVHKDFRNTVVIGLLWRGIAAYIDKYDIRHLFGCGSLHSSNPAEVSVVYSYLNRFHRADERYRVQPLRRLNDVPHVFLLRQGAGVFSNVATPEGISETGGPDMR